MKKVMLSAALGLALSACGGDNSVAWRDPDAVNFTFGAPSSTLTTDEQAAAQNSAAALGEAPAFESETDGATADTRGMNVANLPNQLQQAFGDEYNTSVLRALKEGESTVSAQALALGAGARIVAGPTWDNPDCWTITAAAISYDHCRLETVNDGVPVTTTLNGAIHREAGLVSWDVTLAASAADEGVTVSVSDHLQGRVQFSTVDQTIAGSSRSDFYIRMSATGASVEGAVSYTADYDLTYTTDPAFCVTGGTLTAKRFWSRLPQGADPRVDLGFADAGVQFTWQGCGLVQVAWPVQ